jgi:hypothetical protein
LPLEHVSMRADLCFDAATEEATGGMLVCCPPVVVAKTEQAGLDRVRRDKAMRWLVDKGLLERDEEAENLLGTGEGLPDYDFDSAFRITDSGRELLEEIWRERGRQ